MDAYLLVKWLHVLSSTLLFGTGLGTAFHMLWAWRWGDAAHLASVSRSVVVADWLFTLTAGIAQPVTGLALVHLLGLSPWSGWLVVSYVLYGIALGCWLPVIWLQIRIRDLAKDAMRDAQPLPALAERYMRIWFILGWPAFIALLAVFWLMIAKPEL
jgi:uncharacterized membrane protein